MIKFLQTYCLDRGVILTLKEKVCFLTIQELAEQMKVFHPSETVFHFEIEAFLPLFLFRMIPFNTIFRRDFVLVDGRLCLNLLIG